MKIFVTGGSGFFGGHFVSLALQNDCDVTDIDCLTYAADPTRHNHPCYTRIKADVASPPDLYGISIDAIVHFAAETHVDNSLSGPATTVRTNMQGTVAMLELARKLRCLFVYISTDEVTGDLNTWDPPSTESSPIRASSPYSASKAGADLLVQAYRRSYGLDVVIVRPTNLYGSYQHPEKFIPRAITYALSGRPIPIFAKGQQIRDWLHVSDAARILWLLLVKARPGVYCIGARNPRRNIEVAQMIADKLNGSIEHVTDRPGHDSRYETNPSKAEIEVGWSPQVPFNQGIDQVIEWYSSHVEWWQLAIERGGKW